MNRIQKKCFVASAGFHLLLLVILFIGPAFLSSSEKSDNRPPIDFVAYRTIEEALSGGGSPKARPPAPAPEPQKIETPQPAPPTPRVEKVEPPKVETPDRDTFDTKPAKKLPSVNLKPVVRPNNSPSKVKPTTNPASQTDAADERQNRFASAARNAAKNLHGALSTGTTVEMPGPGGGGVPYANFLDAVKKVYSDAWIVPDGVTDDEATATASVTIARDGTVVNSRMIQSSGNTLADQSVEMVLRRVTFAAPLPDGAKESQRTVKIKFNVKAKRGLG
jgi:protein TonB